MTPLRTDGVLCREFACTRPVLLKVVPVTGRLLFFSSLSLLLFVFFFFFFWDVAMVWKGKPASVTTGSRDRTYVRK